MVSTSARRGAFSRTIGSSVRSEAARSGRAAFFAALTRTSPRSGTPPSITKRAAISQSLGGGASRARGLEEAVAAEDVTVDGHVAVARVGGEPLPEPLGLVLADLAEERRARPQEGRRAVEDAP